ncbi:major capsid protein [Ureibacillus thermophilus]|uniref:Coat protein n=1 Tax=Ureibacillus thermophilus TaxID=367743 RepID=A0A4P6UV77_9BACL|nr:major capsid protein [Ureibacillus thermophilus]QBK26737.1 coat protein [Ureibacillus thermophilus]
MAVTRVSDIIIPEVFNPYVINTIEEQNALIRSGIMGPVPNVTVPNGGTMVNMPFWNDLEGDPEAIQSDFALTPEKITAGKDVARIFEFGKAWSSEDLAAELAGSDPMRAIASRVAGYWTRQQQRILLKMLDGVFGDNAANDNGDLILDVSKEDGTGGTASGEVFIDAAQLLGDAKEKFTAIAVHSRVHANLQKAQLVEYLPESTIDIGFGTYQGKTLIVDDSLPVIDGTTSGKKYTSYLFASGAVGYVAGSPKVPTETDRNTLKGEDILINRQKFIMHVRGFRWTEQAVAGEMPTLAEIGNAANYDRVYDPKKVRVVKIVTNG